MHLHCWQYAQNPATRNMTYVMGGGIPTQMKWAIHEECERCCECHDNRPEGESPAGMRNCIRCKYNVTSKDNVETACAIKIGGIFNVRVVLCLSCQTDVVAAIQAAVHPEAKPPPKPEVEGDGGQRSILI